MSGWRLLLAWAHSPRQRNPTRGSLGRQPRTINNSQPAGPIPRCRRRLNGCGRRDPATGRYERARSETRAATGDGPEVVAAVYHRPARASRAFAAHPQQVRASCSLGRVTRLVGLAVDEPLGGFGFHFVHVAALDVSSSRQVVMTSGPCSTPPFNAVSMRLRTSISWSGSDTKQDHNKNLAVGPDGSGVMRRQGTRRMVLPEPAQGQCHRVTEGTRAAVRRRDRRAGLQHEPHRNLPEVPIELPPRMPPPPRADLPGGQSSDVQRQHHLVDTGQPALTFPHSLRLEHPGPIPRYLDLDGAGRLGEHLIGPCAVADVPPLRRRPRRPFVADVLSHLLVQRVL